MVGYLIIHGVVVILFVMAAFQTHGTVLAAILYVYLWICVYSLYVKSGGNAVV
jgi:hypothetical protein